MTSSTLLLLWFIAIFVSIAPVLARGGGRNGGELLNHSTALIGYSERPNAGTSNKSCEDLDRQCVSRAYQRQCETNAEYMAANCPESCGKCDGSGGPAHDAAMQESIIKIVSDYGVIRIRLRPDWEKDLVADILDIARANPEKKCPVCELYRSEKPPVQPEQGSRNAGPPYGLVQGRFPVGSIRKTSTTNAIMKPSKLTRGMVSLIQNGPNFFISVDHHPEWARAFHTFGQVVAEDMAIVDSITSLPTHDEKWGETQVVVLDKTIPFYIESA